MRPRPEIFYQRLVVGPEREVAAVDILVEAPDYEDDGERFPLHLAIVILSGGKSLGNKHNRLDRCVRVNMIRVLPCGEASHSRSRGKFTS